LARLRRSCLRAVVMVAARPRGWDSADGARFSEVYRRTEGAIARYCARRLASREDAEDAVSDVFVVAWRRRSTLFAADLPLAWLYVVARHVIRTQYEAGQRSSELARLVDGSETERVVPDIAARVAAEVDAQVDAAAVLERLSPVDREILRLLACGDLSLKEVAEVMGMAAGTVRSRLYRMRKAFARDRPVGRDSDPSGRGPS